MNFAVKPLKFTTKIQSVIKSESSTLSKDGSSARSA
jgi:hypothetical protein